jgi:hypothetical protein
MIGTVNIRGVRKTIRNLNIKSNRSFTNSISLSLAEVDHFFSNFVGYCFRHLSYEPTAVVDKKDVTNAIRLYLKELHRYETYYGGDSRDLQRVVYIYNKEQKNRATSSKHLRLVSNNKNKKELNNKVEFGTRIASTI